MINLGIATLTAVVACAGAAFAQPQSTPISTTTAPPPFTRAPIEAPLDATSGFGAHTDAATHRTSFHPGVDFVAPVGTRVVTPADGVVTHADTRDNYGLFVEIDHGNGLKTRYTHLSRFDVHAGDHVRGGDPIGLSGDTGGAHTPKLHFEVWFNNRLTDPAPLLPH